MAKGFRIYGDELGRNGGYVDVDVTGADVEGRIEVAESGVTNPETWTLAPDEIKSLFDDNLAVGKGNVPAPDDSMWQVMSDISAKRKNQPNANFANDRLKSAGKRVFQSLILKGQ